MFEKVKKYVEQWELLTNDDCVIVGVSGGADSICLLLMLLELQKERNFSIVVVHVNHGLRGEDADGDAIFVRELCEKYGVTFQSYFADVESIAKKWKQSIEEAGRNVRRDFFEQAMKEYGGTKIALAHHQNDNVETVLFRMARGTGLKGLGGIAPKNGAYIRPLLCLERKEIEEFLKAQGIEYRVDKTNACDEYARNFIRNQIIPSIEININHKAVHHMNRTVEYLRKIQEYMDEKVKEYMEFCVKPSNGGHIICKEKLEEVDDIFKPLLVKEVLVLVAEKEKDIEDVHVTQVVELFEKQVGRRVDLPYNMLARRVYEGVKICLNSLESKEDEEEIFLDLSKEYSEFEWKGMQIQCDIQKKDNILCKRCEKMHTKTFDCDIIKSGICFRTRRSGDYITIHPDGRTQKLKTYFINEKIPSEERDKILVVADGSHVLWVVGYRVNCVYQVTESTNQVLQICVDKGEEKWQRQLE